MLLKLPIMLSSNALKIPLLCSNYAQSCPIMPKTWKYHFKQLEHFMNVLLECYTYVVTALLEYIDLFLKASCKTGVLLLY